MAEWKKLVVSGSNVSQLFNDAGYLTAGTITQANGYATASVNGVQLIAASSTSSLTFASSSGQGVTLAGSSPGGLNTITVGLSNVPNTSLANSSSTIGTTNVQLGATVTTLAGLTSVTATNFTGTASYATLATTALSANSATSASYATVASSSLFATNASMSLQAISASNADFLDGLHATAFVLNSQTSSMTVTSASFAANASSSLRAISSSFAVSASHADLLDGLSATAFVLNSQTSSMAVSSSLSAISSSYALTASFAINAPNATNALTASNITPAITNALDNRVLTANGGGTINGEANLTFDGTTLILNGSQTISGDLTVNGTTTTINTQNLNVADKFILLSSGSTSANDGGIIIQSATAGTGFAFLYDSAQARWGYTGSLAGNATTAAPDAFAAMVLDLANGSTDIAAYQKNGNIKIDTGDIYIYA
jgi:hypothetical protein